MLSRFLSRTARRTRLLVPDGRRLHAGGAPPLALVQSGIRPESLPRHVAVVTDGNRRWAQERGLLTADGHEAGRRAMEQAVLLSHAWGIRALTVFAFSQENFGRPKARPQIFTHSRVQTSLAHPDQILSSHTALTFRFCISADGGRVLDGVARAEHPRECGRVREVRKNAIWFWYELAKKNVQQVIRFVLGRIGIRIHVIGDPSRRPESLQKVAREAEEKTRSNSKMHLMLATCYSGRWEIVEACRELARKVQGNLLRPEDIDGQLLAAELQTSAAAGELSCPDLLIRG